MSIHPRSVPEIDSGFTLRWLALPAVATLIAFAVAALVIAAAGASAVVEPLPAPAEPVRTLTGDSSVPSAAEALRNVETQEEQPPTF